MSQKQSEASWDEVLAVLDAAGPWPDDFLSESDLRPPLRSESMPLIRDENAPRPSRAVMEKSFEIAEASLRLEGMEPGPRYYALKERVLAGEITPEQAIAEMVREAEAEKDLEIARGVMRDNREALHELAAGVESPSVGPNAPPEQSRLIPGPNGLRVFPARDGRVINLEMIEAAEVAMDIEAARAGGMVIPDDADLVRTPPEDGSRRRWKRRDKENTPQKP